MNRRARCFTRDVVLDTHEPAERLAYVLHDDADEVADAVVELAVGAPVGQAPDFAGPPIYDAESLLRSYLVAIGKHRPILKITMPGAAAAAIREGANLAPDRAVGRRTWEEFLAAGVPADTLSGSTLTIS